MFSLKQSGSWIYFSRHSRHKNAKKKKKNQLTSSISKQHKRLADIAAFSQKVLEEKFHTHGLTTSERSVALEPLSTKSYENIAMSRGVSVRTIKAQASHIYAKLGVN